MDLSAVAANCIPLRKFACPNANDGKHTWVNYYGPRVRECIDCGKTQPMYTTVMDSPAAASLAGKAELGRHVKVTPELGGTGDGRLAFLIPAATWMELSLVQKAELFSHLFTDARGEVTGWHTE
jgi:hypothetical protein